jgi:glycine/sarcosine N-methyltransferase
MYDAFSSDYDRFVNWPSRLAYELPFIEQHLQRQGAVRILDTACGTGMHAIALARGGFTAAGADLSRGMVEKARLNAAEAGVSVPFEVAGFGSLVPAFISSGLLPFDAVLCLGNSLPHVLTDADLHSALADFAACLKPGGLLLLQNRNFDAVMANKQRWMEPQAHCEEDDEWLFLRFYDYGAHPPQEWIDFNILTLHRSSSSPWQQSVTTTRLQPLRRAGLNAALESNGFTSISTYGGMDGSPFNPTSSGNLVLTALRR